MGKTYSAAGQAAACLYTVRKAILQAYQADLLRDMDDYEEVSTDTIRELRVQQIYLSAAFVAMERYLLYKPDIKRKKQIYV